MEARPVVYHATTQPFGRRRWNQPRVPGRRIHGGFSGDTSQFDGDLPTLCGHTDADPNSGTVDADPDSGADYPHSHTWSADADRYCDSCSADTDCYGDGSSGDTYGDSC